MLVVPTHIVAVLNLRLRLDRTPDPAPARVVELLQNLDHRPRRRLRWNRDSNHRLHAIYVNIEKRPVQPFRTGQDVRSPKAPSCAVSH